jgi:hypothetical protein
VRHLPVERDPAEPPPRDRISEVVELLRRGARAVPVPADDSPGGDGPVDEEAEAADAAAEEAVRARDPASCPDPDGRPGQQAATTLPPRCSGGGQR